MPRVSFPYAARLGFSSRSCLFLFFFFFFFLQTYLRDSVGGASVSQGGSLWAVGGQGGHNLGGVSDVLGGDTSSNGENGGEGRLHFEIM